MNNKLKENNKILNLGTFFALYMAQMVPSSFLMTALQVIMREGHYSLTAIGLLHLVRLPWLLKVLWSPFIDRHCLTIRDYKRTIILTEAVYAAALLITGMVNVHDNIMLTLTLVFASLLASATQDIATDALAIITSRPKDRSMLNSMQSMGNFGGALVGSGVLLIILKQFGWNVVVMCLAFFVLAMLLPLCLNKGMVAVHEKPAKRATFKDIYRFFSIKGNRKQIGFLMLYYMGLIGSISMLRPYMVDHGYDIKAIGFYLGIVGTSTSFVMAWLAGLLSKRYGLPKMRIIIGALILLTAIYLLIMNLSGYSHTALLIGIIALQGCYGMATVVVYTTAMQYVRPGCEGTDFTIQIVITHLSGIIIAAIAGFVAHKLGYNGLFAIEVIIGLMSLLYAKVAFKK